jgi:ribonuclease J
MKLSEAGLLSQVKIHEIPLGGRFSVGPFDIGLVGMTHSIPEPNALVIRTGAGTVLHTGDWKFDPDPLIGPTADLRALAALGEAGIDAVICDSTNALRPGVAGSEADVRRSLIDLVGRYRNRVAIACFASNVARLQSAAVAAEENGRSCVLVGRSLWRMEQAARENGYLDGIRPFIREDEAMELPRDQVLLICTGSQGEPRSALTRIAADEHPNVSLDPGDVAIFSSRVIPGNERAIGRLQNQLTRAGVEVVTDSEAFIHVSGHPAQDELIQLYGLVKPRLALPVHGEARHLIGHAKLARDCGIAETLVAENGDIVRIAPGPAAIIDHVETGRLGLEGRTLVPLENGAFRTRLRMNFSGSAVATIVLDRHSRLLARPRVTVHGLLSENASVDDVEAAVERAVNDLTPALRGDDTTVRETARVAVRRSLSSSHGKKPVTDIHVVRV